MLKYYLIKNGILTEIQEPVGWDKFESVLKRSPRHGVLVEFSEVQLAFYCGDGYAELLAEYNANGSDGDMQFRQTLDCTGDEETIYQANINFNDLVHIPGEYIEVNLEQISFGNLLKTREKTKVAMAGTVDMDGNAIAPAEPDLLNLHSRPIIKQFDAIEENPELASYESISTNTLFVHKGWNNIRLSEIPGQFTYSTNFQESNPVTVDEYILKVEEAGRYNFDIDISFVLGVYNADSAGLRGMEFRWILRINGVETALSNPIALPLSYLDADYNSGLVRSQLSITQDLVSGDMVYLFGYLNHPSAFFLGITHELATNVNTNYFRISALTTTTASATNAWPIADVLRQIIYGTTGHPDRFKSDYFTACGSQYFLTDGFQLRNFPNKSLTVSREEVWQGLNPIFALGEGLTIDGDTEKVEIEPLNYFYQNNEILRIDYPEDYTEEVAGEYIYNSIEIGYEKSNTDEFNALDEFNTRREFQTPIKTHDNRLTAISKFVASMYAIETQRRKPYYEGSKVSGAFDKDTFIISAVPFVYSSEIIALSAGVSSTIIQVAAFPEVQTGSPIAITGSADNNGTYTVIGHSNFGVTVLITVAPPVPNLSDLTGTLEYTSGKKAERNEPFEIAENLVSPDTMYNGRISPVRNLLRWSGVVNSGLWFKDPATNVLRFVAGEGNTAFSHQFKETEPCKDGDPETLLINENGNIKLSENNQFRRIWKPEYIVFKAPLTSAQMQVIRQAHVPQVNATEKHGYISVWDGSEYQIGYLLELRFKDADQTGELSSFRLIKRWDAPLIIQVEFSVEFNGLEFN